MTIKLYPAPPPIPGDATAMPYDEQARVRAAALRARRIYPGPLGELVFRELRAYAEFGYRLGDDAVIRRLATALLTTPPDHHGRA
jgi:hypothetical protein